MGGRGASLARWCQFNHGLKDPGSVAVLRKDADGTPQFVGIKGFVTLQKVMCAHVVVI